MKLSRTVLELVAALALTVGTVMLAWRIVHPKASPSATIAPAFLPSPSARVAVPEQPQARVASYLLTAELDPGSHQVQGTGTIAWTNSSQVPVSELYVHLYMNAFASEKSAFMTSRVSNSRGTGALYDPGWIRVHRFAIQEHGAADIWPSATPAEGSDSTDMRLPLPRAVAPGDTVHINVSWTTKLPWIVERAGYRESFHMVGQWFPKVAKLEPTGTFAHFPYTHLSEFYADFGDYDVTINVPAAFTIGATGARVEHRTEGARRIERYRQANVHDFAFAAYDRFSTAERTAGPVRIRCLYPHGFESVAQSELEAAEFGLRFFGEVFGPYPYDTLTIVHPPMYAGEAGGMEYPTLITTGGPWYSPASIGWIRSITLHELAHQYFYGLVATNENAWPFLDEGLATYAEVRALEAGWGASSALGLDRLQISAGAIERAAGLLASHDDIIAQPADAFVSGRAYAALVYARTSLVLRTLDNVYGPGLMRDALAEYARLYRFGHPTPDDLLRVVAEVAGEQASQNLRTALFDRGWVDYAASDLRCQPLDSDYDCKIVVSRRGTLILPVELQVIEADGTLSTVHWDGADQQAALSFKARRPLTKVVIDPHQRVLLDEDLANNVLHTSGERAWRVLDDASYALSLLLSAVMP